MTTLCSSGKTAILGFMMITIQASARESIDVPPAKPSLPTLPAVVEDKVRWRTSYQEALAEAKELKKNVLIDFYADWCGPCKLMEDETYSDKRIIQISREFVCIKVNVDNDRKTAFAYNVSGIPQTVIINHAGQILLDQTGYMDAEKLLELFQATLLKLGTNTGGIVIPQDVLAMELKQVMTVVKAGDSDALIRFLGEKDPEIRTKAVDVFIQLGRSSIPSLVTALSSRYLGVRTTAYAILKKMGAAEFEFDPWEESKVRTENLNKWKVWLSQQFMKEAGEADLKKAVETSLEAYKTRTTIPVETMDRNHDGKPDLWNYKVNETLQIQDLDDDFKGVPSTALLNYKIAPKRMFVISIRMTGNSLEVVNQHVEYISSFKEIPID